MKIKNQLKVTHDTNKVQIFMQKTIKKETCYYSHTWCFIVIIFMFTFLSSCNKKNNSQETEIQTPTIKEPTSADLIELSNQLIERDKYQSAIQELRKISVQDSLFQCAQTLIGRADSLRIIQVEQMIKDKLQSELDLINAGIDFSKYRGSIKALESEALLFESWVELVNEGDSCENLEIRKIANQIKNNVIKIQTKEFPQLRKEYAKVLSRELWEKDISVFVSGSGNKYLNLTGGTFVSNTNKQEYATDLFKKLFPFRFKELRFRWYEGQDEYTFYRIPTCVDTAFGNGSWMSQRDLDRIIETNSYLKSRNY